MADTLFGIVIEVNFEQNIKASQLMEITLFGMVMEVILRLSKALLPIEVTLLGIMVLSQPSIRELFSVCIIALQFSRES